MTDTEKKNSLNDEQSRITILKNLSRDDLTKGAKPYLLLEGGLNENIYEEVSNIEFAVFKQWLYEDTEFDEEKEHGPLLVRIDEKYKLLDQFHNKWMKQHLGVVITTHVGREELIQHLLELRYVELPDKEKIDPLQKVMFRWYEPRQLFGLLNSFDDKKLGCFMQVIEQVSWCEWAFDQGYWFQVNKPILENIDKFSQPFAISQSTMEQMGEKDELYFVRELTRELIDETPSLLKKGDEETLKKAVLNQTRLAISNGIDRRDQIKELIYNKLNRDEPK